MNHDYALVTAAYNEEAFIETTIQSVVAQTIRPVAWVIVSDGSTDNTDSITAHYAAKYSFIVPYRITEPHPRNFAAQVHAINTGLRQLQTKGIKFNFIGNLDADVSMPATYFKTLLSRFEQRSNLGLAGGFIYDRCAENKFKNRSTNAQQSVAHATQFFRRECFEAIGDAYVPLPFGGPDTFAEVSARMKGWAVESFPDLHVLHYRRTGSATGMLRSSFRQGKMDYSLGYLPLFEVCKVLRRVPVRPYLIGALTRLAGFIHSCVRAETRAVPQEFMDFLRGEQRTRLRINLQRNSRRRVPAVQQIWPVKPSADPLQLDYKGENQTKH